MYKCTPLEFITKLFRKKYCCSEALSMIRLKDPNRYYRASNYFACTLCHPIDTSHIGAVDMIIQFAHHIREVNSCISAPSNNLLT
jgi:hypothetical protein